MPASTITYADKVNGAQDASGQVSDADLNEIKTVANSHASDIDGLETSVAGKASATHTHTASQITDFNTAVSANTDVAANKSKLAGIEAGATADLTAGEIEALLDAYYGNTDWRTGGGGGAGTDDQTASEVDVIQQNGVTTANVQTELEAIHSKVNAFGGWVLYDTDSGNLPTSNVPDGSIAYIGATPEEAVSWRWNGSSWFNASETIVLGSDTGTELNLSSVFGTAYNSYASASSSTTFTIASGSVSGGWASVIINASSEPSVTGATKRGGDTFVASSLMEMIVSNRNGEFVFYFINAA